MHIHTLHARTHASFLESQRHDPITGDAFKAGDEVVFCASCRSAFLSESWDYMGRTHCGQSETLVNFPATKVLNFKNNPEVEDELVFSSLSDAEGANISSHKKIGKRWLLRKLILSNVFLWGIIGFSLFRAFILLVLNGFNFSALWSLSVFNSILIFVTFILAIFIYMQYTQAKCNFFAVGKKHVHFFKQKIHYSRVKDLRVNITATSIRFVVNEKLSGSSQTIKCYHSLDYSEILALHFALLEVSKTTKVYVRGYNELVEEISDEYEGNFHLWVGYED